MKAARRQDSALKCNSSKGLRALGFLFLAAGLAWGEWGARGQTVDVSHEWARRLGAASITSREWATGVAVGEDGTVVTVGRSTTETMIMGPSPTPVQGFVAFLPPDGNPANGWLRTFNDVSGGPVGQTYPNAVAVASPAVEPARHAFVGGRFANDVDFGSGIVLQGDSSGDAFLAMVDRDAQQTRWVTVYSGTGEQEVFGVAAGPACNLGTGTAGSPVRPVLCRAEADIVVVAGSFTNEIAYPGATTVSSLGGTDAFVAVVRARADGASPAGEHLFDVTIRGAGDERITAVAIDPADHGVLITGYFSGTDVDFNPVEGAGGPVFPLSYSGGTDIFVARYAITGITPPGGSVAVPGLQLDWLFTTGRSGDDSGAGVGVDVFGYAYATGWVRHAGGTRDLWLGKIEQPPDNMPNATTDSEWSYVYAGDGDEAGLSLAVDGLDRVLVSGQFGQPGAGSLCLDFDPGAGVDQHCTAGGLDLFVTRLRPDGAYDWTFAIGGPTFDEVGAAIDVDPVLTTRIAHAGWFGYPGAPSGYQVDFDPGAGEWLLTCTGSGDGFVSSLVPTIPEGVRFEVPLLIDNSASIEDEPDYVEMMDAFETLLADPLVVPQNGTVAMNAVWFGISSDPAEGVAQLMPWTVMDDVTAPLFARRLSNHPRPPAFSTWMDEGLNRAVASLESSPIGEETYSTVLMIADGGNSSDPFFTDIEGARDDALGIVGGNPPDPMLAKVDQIAALAVRQPPGPGEVQIDRDYVLNHVIGSVTVFDWPDPEGNLGIAAQTPNDPAGGPPYGFTDPLFANILERILMRATVCPSDYDRNGVVDPIEDLEKFAIDSFNGFQNPGNPAFFYADWNFNQVYDGHISGGRDEKKFNTGFQVPGSCGAP